ncbi:hypothetical protein [Photobacterium phosphoreum]|uniref:hypothetical protein n=1 Tax=Photobacterium phosphoreum TaxID=659 RepID=UPI00196117D1|nr:hypothetical protein [Photobacterium phosphoreum]
MSKKSFSALLVISIAIMSIIAFFKVESGFLVGNIVPELIGVCIELLIIIFVFDVWQKNEEKNKKIKVERRLREFLIFFLKHNFKDYPSSCQSGNFYGKDHKKNQECLSNLINDIEKKGLKEKVVLQVQNYCESEKEIFNNLIPVAADLTNGHFKSWVRIAFFMNAIALKSETTSNASIKILENIKRFDRESFTNDLYVGAK